MKSFSVQQILDWIGGTWVNAETLGSQSIQVNRPAPLAHSKSTDVAFFFSKSFEKELIHANPGILVTGLPFVEPLKAANFPFWKTTAVLACANPYLAMAILTEKFAPALSSVAHVPPTADQRKGKAPEIHPSAVVDESVQFGEDVQIGPHCVIEKNVRIGKGTHLYAGCYIGPDCTIGDDCVLFPGVTLYESSHLGHRVRIHARSVLGADGFGYAPVMQNSLPVGHQKIYHLGKVIVGDDVEIGAMVTVDRGTLSDTRIEKNAKLDNHVHIGHNALVDEGAAICGGTCLAGRARVGKYAYIGGLTGIINDVDVGDGALVGALSLVSKDVPFRGEMVGNPIRNRREHFQIQAMLSRLLQDKKRRPQK